MLMLVASQSAADAAADSARAVARVSITFTRNQVLIPVSVNGSHPFMLILDTGMPAPGILLLDSDRVATLGFEFPGTDSLTGGGSGPAVAARVTHAERITVGDLERRNVEVMVIPAQTVLGEADGVIGLELFGNFAVRVEADAEQLTLIEPRDYDPETGGAVVPLRILDGKPFVDARVVVETGPPLDVDLALDLGAGHALWLNERDPGRLAPPPGALHTPLGRGIQGEIRGAVGRVRRLELGGFTFEHVVTLFPAAEFHNPGGVDFKDGFVGAELLTRFVVTFDYSSNRMVLVPGARFSQPFEWDMTGMVLRRESAQRRLVDAVLPGSPAEAAGVRAGDVLVAMNHKPLADLGPDELRQAFQRDGAEVRVTLDRGGTKIEKTLRLRRLI